MAHRSWASTTLGNISPSERRSSGSDLGLSIDAFRYGSLRCRGVFRNGRGFPARNTLPLFRLPWEKPRERFRPRHPVATLETTCRTAALSTPPRRATQAFSVLRG